MMIDDTVYFLASDEDMKLFLMSIQKKENV